MRLPGCAAAIGSCLLLTLVGCDGQDHVVIHNMLDEPVTVDFEFDQPVTSRPCKGTSEGNRTRHGTSGRTEVMPGVRRCLDGPVVGPGDGYDMLQALRFIEVATGDTVCLRGEGDGLERAREQFSEGEFAPELDVDADLCRGEPR